MGSVERTSGTGRARIGLAVAITAAAALTLAACGSSSETATTAAKASSPASTTTTTEEPTTSTETPGAAAGAATLGATGGGRGDGGSSARSSTDTTDAEDESGDEGALGDEVAPDVTWSLGATDYRGQDGLEVTYDCPPDGELGSVWGTGTYTDDSSVCTAAVHFGLITRADGGSVVIEISPGLEAYDPSTANGVTSLAYGAWGGSFTFTVR